MRQARCTGALFVGAMLICWLGLPVVADLAEVHLKSGLILRGDVAKTQTEIIVRNAAGEVRLPLAEVERIVPVGEVSTQPAVTETRPVGGRAAAAREQEDAAAEADDGGAGEGGVGDGDELPPAPKISERDIQRLRLLELTLDGPAQEVRVIFRRPAGTQDLVEEVLGELRQRPDFQPEWGRVLTRGRPHEKLQLIVRETGLKHLDRIDVMNDPPAFEQFRRRVLPMIDRSCGRSGCHDGRSAQVFRMPIGSAKTEENAYTIFVLLDQMETEHGPLINRTNPEASVLLSYLLPQEDNAQAHPEVGEGPSFRAAVQHSNDRRYLTVLDWINYLMVPRPDYELEYESPYAGRPGQTLTDGENQGEERPASQPGTPGSSKEEELSAVEVVPVAR